MRRQWRRVAAEWLEARQLLSAAPAQANEQYLPGGMILDQDLAPLPADPTARPADPGDGLNVGTFDIVLKKGPNLSANPAASAAFDQAALFLESIFSDPVTVVVDAEVAPLGPNILGQTSSVPFFIQNYSTLRDAVVNDRAADESIALALPTAAQFSATFPPTNGGSAYSVGGMSANRADWLALGFSPAVVSGGPNSAYEPSVPRDMSITFSTNFPFDYDRSDGIGGGLYDFVGVAIHEIAHGLGFTSEVDTADAMQSNPALNRTLFPTTLDLYRLQPGAGATNFTNAPRVLATGNTVPNQVFYDGGIFDPSGITNPASLSSGEVPMSTGIANGDGRQASHWKDNQTDGGVQIGIMDPSALDTAVQLNWTPADTRAMGLIGWNVAAVTATPGAPDLVAASDTGSSSTDNLTNRDNSTAAKTLQFSVGNTVAGGLVTIYADGKSIGSATAGGTTTVVTTNGALDLADGSHVITARQAEAIKAVSNASASLTINVDTVAPVTADVVDVSPDPRQSAVSSVGVTFSQSVSGSFSFSNLTLTRDGVNVPLSASNNPTSGDGGVTWTVPNLSSLTSATGTYVLSVALGLAPDAAGNTTQASDTWQNFPAWLSTSSIASWNGTAKTLAVSGASTIVGDPLADLPAVTCNSGLAALTISVPSGTQVNIASLTLLNGAVAIVTNHGAGAVRPLVMNGNPSIDGTSKLDLTNNVLVMRSGDVNTSKAQTAAGFHAGAWDGVGGITSSSATAAGDPQQVTALGYASNATLNKTSFAGVTGLTSSAVFVKYTYYGDGDLSGTTTLDDFTLFLNGYQNSGTTWFQGDYDFGGLVTLDDFTLFLKGYQQQGAPQ
jgi:hypothetical protein